MQELIILNDLDTSTPKLYVRNFDELMAGLVERLEFYNNLVVTEDAIKNAKEDRATLNKLKTALDDERKKIKKQCLALQSGIETQIKQLIAPIDESISTIDRQLAVFEDQRKEEKRQKVEAMYDEIIPDKCKDIIPLDRIFDPRWLNSSTTDKAIREALEGHANSVYIAIMTIERIEPEYQMAAMTEYAKTLDLARALESREQAISAAAAFSQASPTVNTTAEERPAEPVLTPPVKPAQGEKVYRAKLDIRVTMAQWEALTKYMTDAGIEYTRI